MSLSRVGRGNVSDGAARTFVRILYARLHKAGSGRGFLRWQTGRGSSEAVRWKNNQQHQARTVSAHRGKCAAMSAYRGEYAASSGPKISLSRSSCSGERTIWIADAHRDDGQRFVVHADEKLTAFLCLGESYADHCAFKMQNDSARFSPCSLLRASPWESQEIDCKLQSNSR
jgi:hypothetical protein